ncbi:Retrovirus-related Pol polyprotein from transposon 297 [Frankliniella fusca]|uniref:Retrovirus-related Pol polyprotein from transposon 297 n=1 Tax=Frankliniella fusca TaxID=407009 RepID=A0AAE1HK63_9NEOP|nr:Retrovirus-related Pol polyprotein from transposon 297 [Frankliniella fusca]
MATELQIRAAAELLKIGIRLQIGNDEKLYTCQSRPFLYVVIRHTGPFECGHFDPLVPSKIFHLCYDEKFKGLNNDKKNNQSDGFNATRSHGTPAALESTSSSRVGCTDIHGERPDMVALQQEKKARFHDDVMVRIYQKKGGWIGSEIGKLKPPESPTGNSETGKDGLFTSVDARRKESRSSTPAATEKTESISLPTASPRSSSTGGATDGNSTGDHTSVCESTFPCSCCYETDDLAEIMEINWEHPIQISDPAMYFPIKVKVNGKKMIGFIDNNANCSVISPKPWLKSERVQSIKGNLESNNEIVQLEGIFNPDFQVSERIKIKLPTVIAKLPEGVDLILGKNFINKLKGFKLENPEAYSFYYNHECVEKYKVKIPVDEQWETLTVSDEKFNKLFKIELKVDGLKLPAILDLGAVRSIINSKYCTNKAGLKPVKIKLRTANDTYIKVDGIYKAAITIEGCTVHHYVVSAELPGDVPMLLGNDFLAKYRSDTSWNTETLTLRMGVSTVVTNRLKEENDSENKKEMNRINKVDEIKPNCENTTVFLYSTTDVEINAGMCGLVEIISKENVLPAVLSPCAVMGNLDVSTVECFLLDETVVPIFNCSENSIFIPKGTKIACVTPENKNIEESRLSSVTPGELAFAMQNNLIRIEGNGNLPSEECFTVESDGEEAIPSLDGADISESEKEEVREMCRKYSDVFGPGMKPHAPVPNFIGHLERTNEGSIFRRQWPLSAKQKAIARKEINKFLDWGVVEEGESIVHMPFFVIEKRGSTIENPMGRCLYDCRYLNKVLVKPQFKSYRVNDILTYCADKSLLCTLDINHYFFNIAVTEESKLLLGFTFEGRSLRWTRLPQGLALSPQISIAALGIIFKNLPIRYYVDDIIVGGNDFQSLLSLLEQVLQRLRASNLTVHPKKANLFKKELSIIGLTVKAGEYVKPNPSRFKPLLALKDPKNAKELRSVLMFFSYYRRWIKSFAIKTQKKTVEDMYQYLLSTATLALFHEERPTKLHCDASNHSIGSFLAQKSGNNYKPVAYFSAPIKGTKLAWSAFHKECLALYESVKYFEDELRLVNSFTVVTDCSSLKYLLSMEAPKSPFDKFISFLCNFNFDFELVRSEQNKIPDSLSRLTPPADSKEIIQIPEKLVIPLTPAKILPEKQTEEKLNRNQVKVSTRKVPVFYLPDGSEEFDFDYVDTSSEPIVSFTGNFEFLSNFYPVQLEFEKKIWPSVEHAFQGAKTDNENDKERIRNAATPAMAKRMGRFVDLKENWESLRNEVMLELLWEKFKHNTDLALKLLSTGEREIIECNTWCDMYWGQCTCPKHRYKIGLNMLGKMLTQIRDLKRDCPNLTLTDDDRKNLLIAVVTRSRAKQSVQNGNQQISDEIIDQPTGKQGGHDSGREQPVAETVRTPAIGTHPIATPPIGTPVVDKPAEPEAADDTSWRQDDILNSPNTIKHFSDEFYCLSNHAPSTFTVDGEKYLSVEDALDTKGFRFNDPKYLSTETVTGALEKIRANLREAIKKSATEFLIKCLTAKFTQNPELKKNLLKTEGKLLLYCNKICDNYLGLCQCSVCKANVSLKPFNVLGVELMKLRTRFIRENELDREATRFENTPPIEKFKLYQRNDSALKKIIETFDSNGMPTDKTERHNGVPKNLDEKISEFVNSCTKCQEFKPSKERYGLLRRRITSPTLPTCTHV